MARKFQLADGTVGMLDDDGTFTPGAEGTAPAAQAARPAAQPAQAPAPSAQPDRVAPGGLAGVVAGQPAPEEESLPHAVGRQFADIGRGVLHAGQFAQHAMLHPVDTFGHGNARPVLSEVIRGVNDTIPFGNTISEAVAPGASYSAEDAARTPGARDFGSNVVSAPIMGAEGKIVGKLGADAVARSAARHAANSAPVEAAAREAYATIKERARKMAEHALGLGGAEAALSHIGAGLVIPVAAAARLTSPLLKPVAIAADEGAAAIARHFGAGGVPTRLLAQEAPTAAERVAGAAPTPTATPTPPPHVPASSPVGAREEATMVSPARAGGPPPEPTQRVAKRVSIKPPTPTNASSAAPAELSPGTQKILDEIEGRKPLNPNPDISPQPRGEPPKFQPSKYDEKYAKKTKMTLEEYRKNAQDRRDRAFATVNNPHAPLRAKAEAQWLLRGPHTNAPAPGEALEAAE